MKIYNNVKVICAGCNTKHSIESTVFYRNKRWCQKPECKEVIDKKVKHFNYKKAMKKIEKGTFRHGVRPDLREYVRVRDNHVCRICFNKLEEKNMQVHHIVPVANGGDDDYNNLVLLCNVCHTNLHKHGWENYIKQLKEYTTKVEHNSTVKIKHNC